MSIYGVFPTYESYRAYIEGMVVRGIEEHAVREMVDTYARFREYERLNKVGMYEDAFRDRFIEEMITPNFSFYRAEAVLFDLVAYRTTQDAKSDTPFYIWENRNNERYGASVKRHLEETGLTDLPPPPTFPGEDVIYGFEFKTNADDPNRFLEQVPRYCWFMDYVVLVLAENIKRPPHLPSWVAVVRFDGVHFAVERKASKSHTFLGKGSVDFAKWWQPHEGEKFEYHNASGWGEYMAFLRRIAINGVFHKEIVPYTVFDYAFIEYLRRVKRNTRVEGSTLPDDEFRLKRASSEVVRNAVEQAVLGHEFKEQTPAPRIKATTLDSFKQKDARVCYAK